MLQIYKTLMCIFGVLSAVIVTPLQVGSHQTGKGEGNIHWDVTRTLGLEL